MKRELLELAKLYGIHTSYVDMAKQRRQADPEALLLVLRAMGAGVERFEDVGQALAHLRRGRAQALGGQPGGTALGLVRHTLHFGVDSSLHRG